MTDLCLIVGEGRLPGLLREVHPEARVIALEGNAPTGVETFRLETLGTLLADLERSKVRRLCLAGAIRRPVIDLSLIDTETAPLVQRIVAALGQGDDGALRVLIELVEERGIEVVGAHALRPDLLPDAGAIGSQTATERDEGDITRGFHVLDAIGPADVGQGCVVAGGQVLAVEALPGTDWMLSSVAAMRATAEAEIAGSAREMNLKSQTLEALGLSRSEELDRPVKSDGGNRPLATHTPAGGVFVKAPKPGQDMRVDLPAIGPETVDCAAAAGLTGIAIRAGGVLVLDRDEVAGRADAAGLWVRAV